MTDFQGDSRILKAFTDGGNLGFHEARGRLQAARVSVVVDALGRSTAAGQSAALTALATAQRTFGRVTLVTSHDVGLLRPIFGASTLLSAARQLNADVQTRLPSGTTHTIVVGAPVAAQGFIVRCSWDRWRADILPAWETRVPVESWNPLSGAFAGAVAVREVFAHVRGERSAYPRAASLSLWEPWRHSEDADPGPIAIHLPSALWLVGLGHVGQGFLWNLAQVPANGDILLLQDYQLAQPENVATGLVTRPRDVGHRKTRIAAAWIESFGWKTELIERKFMSATRAMPQDPPIIVSGLDSVAPRKEILAAGFPYMVDIGVGHGPRDFECGQLRVLARGEISAWNHEPAAVSHDDLLKREAYQTIARYDPCGAVSLAQASVAVPFVGAAMGAVAVSQVARLGAMESPRRLLQLELSAPDMVTASDGAPAPTSNLGTVSLNFSTGEFA